MAIFSSILIIASAAIFCRYLFRGSRPIVLLRSIAMIVSVSTISMLNINWLTGKPMAVWHLVVIFLGLAAIFVYFKPKRAGGKSAVPGENLPKLSKPGWLMVILAFCFMFLISYGYFQGKLDTPRYLSPDPATHYLYMSMTAETGMIPMFMPSVIYPASGNNAVFKDHQNSYFPGAAAGFFLLSKILFFIKTITLFQVFNILFYSSLSLYFLLSILERKKIPNHLVALLAFFLLSLGAFFDFVAISFTTQMLGLYMLVFFCDSYYEYRQKRMPIFVPIMALSGVILTYFYWLPVALSFMFFTHLFDIAGIFPISGDKFKRKGLVIFEAMFIFLVAVILSGAYIERVIKINVVGHSVDAGGFNFMEIFMSGMLTFLPLALLHLCSLIKKSIKEKKADFLAVISSSALLWTLVLMLGFYSWHIVSGYAWLKSFYLTLPIVIILVMDLFSGYANLLRSYSKLNFDSIKRIKKSTYVWLVVLIMAQAGAVGIIGNIRKADVTFFPLVNTNKKMITKTGGRESLTRDQMAFLDVLKAKHPEAIDGGRITAITDSNTSLWIFAYSGIWPRTPSVLAAGQDNNSASSTMCFTGTVDYRVWLENDRDHYLVIFNNAGKWTQESGFNPDDFDVVYSVGENYLYKLKNNKVTQN